MSKDIEISEEDKNYIENVINWTFPGSRFYYRDTNVDIDVEGTYKIGQIIRAGIFIDTSLNAKKPCSKVRYIIGSAHAAEMYKTDMCNQATKDCEICVFHLNSYFKVMDIYKVKDQYQIFLFHIPMHGIPVLENASFNFDFGDGKGIDYFVERARASFDEKLKMEVDEKLESSMWKQRTNDPIGVMADGSLFNLDFQFPPNEQVYNIEIACRKIAGDLDPINLPAQD